MIPDKFEQLIHESECTYLDFKRAQYPFQGASGSFRLLEDDFHKWNLPRLHL
jgi:hypothetical protein